MDWVWTDTTLSLSNWMCVEDIYANIFIIKCSRETEKVPGQRMGGSLLGVYNPHAQQPRERSFLDLMDSCSGSRGQQGTVHWALGFGRWQQADVSCLLPGLFLGLVYSQSTCTHHCSQL